MTLPEWKSLRRGDIIQSRSGTLRIVIRANPRHPAGIQLVMLRPSWRSPCPLTTYVACDRDGFELTGRRVRKVPVVRCPNPDHARLGAHRAK